MSLNCSYCIKFLECYSPKVDESKTMCKQLKQLNSFMKLNICDSFLERILLSVHNNDYLEMYGVMYD